MNDKTEYILRYNNNKKNLKWKIFVFITSVQLKYNKNDCLFLIVKKNFLQLGIFYFEYFMPERVKQHVLSVEDSKSALFYWFAESLFFSMKISAFKHLNVMV